LRLNENSLFLKKLAVIRGRNDKTIGIGTRNFSQGTLHWPSGDLKFLGEFKADGRTLPRQLLGSSQLPALARMLLSAAASLSSSSCMTPRNQKVKK